jgi:hypothetical protein
MDRLAVENTDFVPPAHLPFDEVVNSLAGALQAVVALPPSPAASALAKRTRFTASKRLPGSARSSHSSSASFDCTRAIFKLKRVFSASHSRAK